MKLARFSALRTGRLYPPGIIPGTHSCYRLNQPQGHSAAGRIVSMKNSSDIIENQTCDLPVCSVSTNCATACLETLPTQHLRVAVDRKVVVEDAVALLAKTMHYKQGGSGFDSRCHWNFLYNTSGRYTALGKTQPIR
jgi:Fe-S oxidoreductase